MKPLYYTKRVFKGNQKARIVEENLTEKQAQKRVQQDMKTNPDANYYMLVYAKQSATAKVGEIGISKLTDDALAPELLASLIEICDLVNPYIKGTNTHGITKLTKALALIDKVNKSN